MTEQDDTLTGDLLAQNNDLNDENRLNQPVFCRHPYNYCSKTVSDETGISQFEPTLTQQHQAKETDINYIVQQFGITGMLPTVSRPPTYGDFTGVFDYQSAMDLIIQADRSFQELPAEARAHFGNNPANFLNFMENNPSPELLAGLGLGTIIPPPASSTPSSGASDA